MSNFNYEITEHLAVISKETDGTGEEYTMELNKVSWGGHQPKYDLRTWWSNHQRMSKGITLNDTEFAALKEIIKAM